jgi:hypothetical protein
MALGATPAAAQVDVGVWTPNGGGRVVLGGPTYYPAPVYAPVYEPVYVYPQPRVVVVERDYYYRPYRVKPGRAFGHYRHGRYARAYYPRASRVVYVDKRHYRGDRYYRSARYRR